MNTKSNIAALSSALFVSMTFTHARDAEIPKVVRPDPRAAAKAALLQKYDKDGNGRLDASEVETIARDRLREFDRNKDGKVDQVELRLMRAQLPNMPKTDPAQRALARDLAIADAKRQEAIDRERAARPGPDANEK